MEIVKRTPSADDLKGALTAKVNGGIANRMEHAHHVIATVREANRVWQEDIRPPLLSSKKINIIWHEQADMVAGYDDIFKPLEDKNVTVFTYSSQDDMIAKGAYDPIFGAYSRPRYLLSKIKSDPMNIAYYVKHYLLQDYREVRRTHSVFDKMIKGVELGELIKGGHLEEGSVFIKDQYWEGYSKLLVAFELIDELQQRVLSLTEQFGESTIGIHIRQVNPFTYKTSDHFTDYETYESFAALMQREIDENPAVCFFLASDHSKIKEQLISRFGTRVVAQQGVLGRDTVEGIQQGAVDLYTLAQTDRILCRTGSFARWAAAVRGISCQRICRGSDGIVRFEN